MEPFVPSIPGDGHHALAALAREHKAKVPERPIYQIDVEEGQPPVTTFKVKRKLPHGDYSAGREGCIVEAILEDDTNFLVIFSKGGHRASDPISIHKSKRPTRHYFDETSTIEEDPRLGHPDPGDDE